MRTILSFILVLAVVVLSSAQLFGPPRIVLDDQNQPTNTGWGSWWGGRGGNGWFRGGPPAGGPGAGGPFGGPGPWGGPFDNVYNTKGDKLTCKMMCEPEKAGGSTAGGLFGGPWGGPFDNVYNTNGDKLACRMMCEPEKKADIDIVSVAASEKKETKEDNKIEKKD